MTSRKRSANWAAILPADRRAWLRVGLLEHYEADTAAMAALEALAAAEPTDDAIVAVAHDLGLDRLHADHDGNLAGVDLIRRWIDERRVFGPIPLSGAGGRSAAVPTLPALDPPSYHPGRERRAGYLARVAEYVTDREAAAERAGYEFLDTAQTKKHSRWLYLRMRYNREYSAIAVDEQLARGGPSAGGVGLAVRRIARLAGADV